MFKFVSLETKHWPRIPEKARPRACEDTKGIIAINHRNEPVAAALFDTWSFNSCQIHIWIGNPYVLRHGFAEEAFNFVFSEESGREVIVGVTPADNAKALKFIRNIGFEDQGVIPDGFKVGVDLIITTMRKETCRWINKPLLRAVGG